MAIPTARERDVADAVVAKIATTWSALLGTPVPKGSGVERTWLPDVSSKEELHQLSGRQVRVTPVGTRQVEKVDRKSNLYEYLIFVLVLERHTNAGQPSKVWTDERCDFVAALIEDLGDERQPFLLNSFYPDGVDWPVPCDLTMLRSHGLFWSGFELSLREVR